LESPKNYEELKKKLEENKEKIKNLVNDVNILKKDVKKLEIARGSKFVSEFEIENEQQWDQVEKALIQKGTILEYEISKKLEQENIDFEPNDTFIYPSERHSSYIDYFFSSSYPFHAFKEGKDVQTAEFETDFTINEVDKIITDDFEILLDTYYFIECKSRTNPPINYLFILNKFYNQVDSSFRSFLVINGSNFVGIFNLKSNILWPTSHEPIQVSYPKQIIDNKSTLSDGFWQIFRRIDYECHKIIYFDLFFNNYYKKIAVPSDMELPKHCSTFNVFFDKWIKNSSIPTKLKEKIKLNIEIFIPIIIVNGNIYSIDLDTKQYTNFIEITKKEPGFIREFSYLRQGLDKNYKYHHLYRFLMKVMGHYDICFKDDIFLPSITEPVLYIPVISSSDFIKVFKKLREEIKIEFHNKIKNHASHLYLENKDELFKFQVFRWVLSHSEEFYKDFLNKCYEIYKKI